MFRIFGLLFGNFIAVFHAFAVNPGERTPSPQELQVGENYAQQLYSLTSMISAQYVREVPTATIYESAINALYEAARQTTPPGLIIDLKNAHSGNDQLRIVALARAKLGTISELEGNRDLTASIKGLSSALDPYCGLVLTHEFQNRGDSVLSFGFDLDGEQGDVNVLRTRLPSPREDSRIVPFFPFRVISVRPGGPAQSAGMRPGDSITQIDGRAITVDSAAVIYQDVFSAIDVADTKEHVFTVKREGKANPVQLKVRKAVYVPESIFGVNRAIANEWNYWLDAQKKLAYIRVGAIELSTPQQLTAALENIQDAKGLILDMRWCPGGYLNQSAEIAGIFMETGKVATLKYRNPERQGPTEFRADSVGINRFRANHFPLVVLVNGETLGGGELIACALQDNQRAAIAGQRTRGKASIQTPLYINSMPGWTFKLTAGTFVRPSGKNLQRFPDSKTEDDWGVRPDRGMEIPISPSLSKQLKDWNLLYALRPGSDREAMPLDDPQADPQRWIALKMLRKLVTETEKKGAPVEEKTSK